MRGLIGSKEAHLQDKNIKTRGIAHGSDKRKPKTAHSPKLRAVGADRWPADRPVGTTIDAH